MIKLGGLLAAVALVTGCGSSDMSASQSASIAAREASQEARAESEANGGSNPASARTSDYPTAASAVMASCAAFDRFANDLNRFTPRQGQAALIRDAQAIVTPLIRTPATLSGRSRKLYDDANTLLAHVGSTSWPTNGTPVDRQITNVSDDCA